MVSGSRLCRPAIERAAVEAGDLLVLGRDRLQLRTRDDGVEVGAPLAPAHGYRDMSALRGEEAVVFGGRVVEGGALSARKGSPSRAASRSRGPTIAPFSAMSGLSRLKSPRGGVSATDASARDAAHRGIRSRTCAMTSSASTHRGCACGIDFATRRHHSFASLDERK